MWCVTFLSEARVVLQARIKGIALVDCPRIRRRRPHRQCTTVDTQKTRDEHQNSALSSFIAQVRLLIHFDPAFAPASRAGQSLQGITCSRHRAPSTLLTRGMTNTFECGSEDCWRTGWMGPRGLQRPTKGRARVNKAATRGGAKKICLGVCETHDPSAADVFSQLCNSGAEKPCFSGLWYADLCQGGGCGSERKSERQTPTTPTRQ